MARLRLASSFDYLAEVCGPAAGIDVDRVKARTVEIAAATRVRPDLFIIHHQVVTGARAGDLPAIRAGFHALCDAPVASGPGLVRRNWCDAGFCAAEAARYGMAFAEMGDATVALGTAPPGVYRDACDMLGRAEAVLLTTDAELHAETIALVTEVVFACVDNSSRMTFDGITSFYALGALVLNADEHRTVHAMLAALVHEAAHTLLFTASQGAALVTNPPDERYASPLRPDKRPVEGIFHAAFVSARMSRVVGRALAADALPAAERDDAVRFLAHCFVAFQSAYGVVARHGRPTALGAAFMDGAVASMDGMLRAA